jgi:hypothetical protein
MEKDKKVLFTFQIPHEVEVEVEEKDLDIDGKTEITRKRKHKEIQNKKFYIRKPSRGLKEDAEVFYSATYGRLLEAGLMPAVLVEKRYIQDGGVLSETEIKVRKELYTDLFDFNGKLVKAKEDKNEELTKELQEKIDTIIDNLGEIESKNQGLFSNTAEAKAKERLVIYYTLFTSFNDDNTPFFGAGKYEEKRDKLSEIEEDGSDFDVKCVSAFLGITSIYFNNPKITQEDINKFVDQLVKV